jgi:hypothetical protein
MSQFVTRSAAIGGLLLTASCATPPQAPTAIVTPGPGKTDVAFQADLAACKAQASNSVAGQVNTANRVAVAGAVLGVAAGGVAAQPTIQQQYDTTFNNCMFAAGDNVPGMVAAAPVQEEAPRPVIVRDPLVRSVQVGLVRVGYLHGGADGVAGPKTAAAIRQYETDKGLPVDGVASQGLLASIRSTEAAAPAPTDASASSGDKWAVPPPPPTTAASQ